MHVEAMSKRQRGTIFQVGLDLGGINSGDLLIREQHHYYIRTAHGFRHFLDGQAGLLRFAPGSTILAQPNSDRYARIVQIIGVSVALRAITHNGNFLVLDEGQDPRLYHNKCSWFPFA